MWLKPISTISDVHDDNLSDYLTSPWCRKYASVNRIGIGSDNGLSHIRRQAIIWTDAGLLSIGPLGTKFSENLIKIQFLYVYKNASENIVCEMATILSRSGGGGWV